MTNNINSDMFWARDVIEKAQRILMNRFDLDAASALQVLRKMSQNTGTPMCVVAEQIINHNVPVDAVLGLEEHVLGLRPNHIIDRLGTPTPP